MINSLFKSPQRPPLTKACHLLALKSAQQIHKLLALRNYRKILFINIKLKAKFKKLWLAVGLFPNQGLSNRRKTLSHLYSRVRVPVPLRSVLCQLRSCSMQQRQMHQVSEIQDKINHKVRYLFYITTYCEFYNLFFFFCNRMVDKKNSCKSVSRSKSPEEAAAKLAEGRKHRWLHSNIACRAFTLFYQWTYISMCAKLKHRI